MNCQELDSLFQTYLDGEFQTEERLEVETHLSGCGGCSQRLQGEAHGHHALRRATRRALESTRAPEALRARLHDGLRGEQRRASQGRWLRASAAVLAVGVVGGLGLSLRPGHRALIEGAARQHSRKLPTEVAGAAEHVEAWVNENMDYHVSVPQLPNMRLKGARISNVTDHPAAYISYEAQRAPDAQGFPARRVSLFVFGDSSGDVKASPLPAVEVDSSHGYNVAVWRENEVVYELVSDLDESDIRSMIAQQMRARAQAAHPASPDADTLPASLP